MNQDLLDADNAAQYLQNIFKYRTARNSNYSSRAFARDLKLDISQLSKVLKGQQGFSKKKAENVSRSLSHTPQEAEYFWSLLELRFSKSHEKKDAAKERLIFLKKNSAVKETAPTEMDENLSWLHFAVLEAVKAEPVSVKNPKISALRDVKLTAIKKCIEDLLSWGMLKAENGYAQEWAEQRHYGSQTSSSTIRRLHSEFITKAHQAIEEQSLQTRELFSVVLRFDTKRLAEARRDIDRFKREFNLKYSDSKNKDGSLYAACFQFFDLFSKKET